MPTMLPKGYYLVLAALFTGALAAGYLILPGERERVAMLERDGKMREALSILERRFVAGDRSSTTVYQLQEIYLHYGDLKRAREMLELMVTLRPRDLTAQRRLASFYRQTQDEPAYLAALKRRLDLRFQPATCTELVGLLRQRGDVAAEVGALQSCWQKGYRQTEDMIRFATLLAERDDPAQASQILRTVDDRLRLRSDRERQLLFQLLVEIDQPREAQRRAVRWLRGNRNDAFGLALTELLAAEGRHEDALQLAREAGEPGGSLSLAVAELMLDRGEIKAAATYLRGWLVDGRIERSGMASRFVQAALDAEAPLLAYDAALKVGLDAIAVGDLTLLAEALGAIGRRAEFDAVRKRLTPEQLAENPLLGAAVELNSGETTQSRALLSQVRVDQLDEWRLALWARLMEQTNPPSARLPTPPAVERPTAERSTVERPPARAGRRLRQALQKQQATRARRQPPAATVPPPAPLPAKGTPPLPDRNEARRDPLASGG